MFEIDSPAISRGRSRQRKGQLSQAQRAVDAGTSPKLAQSGGETRTDGNWTVVNVNARSPNNRPLPSKSSSDNAVGQK